MEDEKYVRFERKNSLKIFIFVRVRTEGMNCVEIPSIFRISKQIETLLSYKKNIYCSVFYLLPKFVHAVSRHFAYAIYILSTVSKMFHKK